MSTLIRRTERFAKTGVGWILRDLSKHQSAKVKEFIDGHLSWFSVSLRNALKYSSKAEQQRFLKRLIAAQQQHAA